MRLRRFLFFPISLQGLRIQDCIFWTVCFRFSSSDRSLFLFGEVRRIYLKFYLIFNKFFIISSGLWVLLDLKLYPEDGKFSAWASLVSSCQHVFVFLIIWWPFCFISSDDTLKLWGNKIRVHVDVHMFHCLGKCRRGHFRLVKHLSSLFLSSSRSTKVASYMRRAINLIFY